MRFADAALLAGRAMMSVMFLLSGWTKLTTPEVTKAYFLQVHIPMVEVAYPIAIVTELAGALMLLLGFRARIGAFVLGAYCVATALMVHATFATPVNTINFNKNIAMAGGYLAFVVVGAGAYAVDRLMAVRRQQRLA